MASDSLEDTILKQILCSFNIYNFHHLLYTSDPWLSAMGIVDETVGTSFHNSGFL